MIEIHGGRGKVNIIDSLVKRYDVKNGVEVYIDDKIRLNISRVNDYAEVFYVNMPKDLDEAQELFGNFRRGSSDRLSWLIFYIQDISEEQKQALTIVLNVLEEAREIEQGILVYN